MPNSMTWLRGMLKVQSMETFDFIAYMRDCAIRLRDILHTPETPRFFRISGLSQLEELLSSLPEAHFPALLVENNADGRMADPARSDNYVDIPYYVFYVLDKAPFGDFDRIEQVKASTKRTGQKIFARMLHDRANYANGLVMLRFDQVPYQSVGPLGDGCYGTMFSFSVVNPAPLKHDALDWLEDAVENPETGI